MRKNQWAIKHDLSHTRIYKIWIGMRSRCLNSRCSSYQHYGAKGIRVCDEWNSKETGFVNFYKWSVSNGYSDDLTIDRIDATGNYEPSNCRWADKYTQNVHLNRKRGISGYIGICKHSNSNTWYGRVKVYGKVICTGCASTALGAAIMRDQYIISHGLINQLNGVGDASN